MQGGGKSTSQIGTSTTWWSRIAEPSVSQSSKWCIVHHITSPITSPTALGVVKGGCQRLFACRTDFPLILYTLVLCTRYESATMKRIIVDNASQPSSEDAGTQSKTVSSSTSSGTSQSPEEQRQRNVLPPEIMEILVPSTQVGAVTGVLPR